MSAHLAFRRQPVPGQVAQKLTAASIPAPTRGLTTSENWSAMKPGGAIVCDNWIPTMRGLKLRGGSTLWSTLPEPTPIISAFEYASANIQKMFAANATKLYDVSVIEPVEVASGRTSGNYAAAQLATANDDYMIAVNDAGDPPLRYDGLTWTALTTTTPTVWQNAHAYAVNDRALDTSDYTRWKVVTAHTSEAAGTFAADRLAHPSYWVLDTASDGVSWISGPPGSPVENGGALVHVWKYRNRLFFIERSSMNAWYLPLNATGGKLGMIPLSGAASEGGKLLFGAVWSIDAGDGTDDKCVFATDRGELLIFTGSNPGDINNWKQEGRYQIPPPMGMNAHIQVGGDLLIATVDGLVPTSAAITKEAGQLDLAAVSYNIRSMWREEAIDKREWPWTMKRWDEYGGMFVTLPGGKPGKQRCLGINTATIAWCRFTGWDATCFMMMRGDMFFGTQTGKIMQADRGGTDDGAPYVATLVGGWGSLQSQPSHLVWYQSRASFLASAGQPFQPQLSACVDFIVTLPPPPQAGPDPGLADVWDQGLWGPGGAAVPPSQADRDRYAQWDQAAAPAPTVRNTGWVSVGRTGYTHAPVVQVTVAQQARPNVELISIDATFERLGVNV